MTNNDESRIFLVLSGLYFEQVLSLENTRCISKNCLGREEVFMASVIAAANCLAIPTSCISLYACFGGLGWG